EQGVDDEVGPVNQLFARLTTCIPQDAKRDSPVAAVRSPAANGSDAARLGIAAQNGVGDRAARPFHQRLDVVALLGGAHLLRRVERLEHQCPCTCWRGTTNARRRLPPRWRAPASASSTG